MPYTQPIMRLYQRLAAATAVVQHVCVASRSRQGWAPGQIRYSLGAFGEGATFVIGGLGIIHM